MAVAVVGTTTALPTAAGAAPSERAGAAVVVNPSDRSKVAAGGDSNSVFALRLPDGAACPGDTYHDDWRLQSFIVPATEDPGALKYQGIGPEGPKTDAKWALYGADTVPFVNRPTSVSDGAGRPGLVLPIAPFSFKVFRPAYLPPGRYRIGIACTLAWVTKRYWDAEIEITPAADVQPGQFRWKVVDPPRSVGGGPGLGERAVRLAAIAAVVIGAGAIVVGLRRRDADPEPSFTKEQT